MLRPNCHSDGTFSGDQNKNINNRYLIFQHLFASITRLPVEKCYWDPENSFDTPHFYELLNCPLVNELSWFSIYEKENLPEKADAYLLRTFQNAFVVGFEIPPILRNFFSRNNIPYVNLIDYPIRFLDDTLVGFSTNNSDIFNTARTYEAEEEGFYIHAALAKIKLQTHSIIENDSVVFFGQTPIDLSLHKEGKCLQILDFENEIINIAKNHKKVYFKMHPHGQTSEALTSFIKNHNIEITSYNAYEILSNDNVKTVVSISSSILEEAKYFRKNSICLHKMPHKYTSKKTLESFNCLTHIPLGHDILLPNFWYNIFQCLHLTKENQFNNNLSFEPNTLRCSTAAFWGYDKLYKPSVCLHNLFHPINIETNRLNIEINRLNIEINKLNSEVDEYKKHCKKIYTRKIIPRLQRLFIRIGKQISFKTHF